MNSHHSEFAKFQHDYITGNIAAADQKEVVILAIASGLLGYAISNPEYVGWLRTGLTGFAELLSSLSIILLVLSAACALKVLWPSLKGEPKGIVYWQSVSGQKSKSKFVADVSKCSAEELTTEILEHNFEIANVCNRKFQWLRGALWAGLLGVAFLFCDFAIVANRSKPPNQDSSTSIVTTKKPPGTQH